MVQVIRKSLLKFRFTADQKKVKELKLVEDLKKLKLSSFEIVRVAKNIQALNIKMKINIFNSSHFKNTIWITAFSVTIAIALSDVNTDCIAKNNGTISNDFLLGTWYKIYNFIHLGPYPTCSCLNVTFSRPTEEELRGYREKFKSIDLPHEIDNDAVVADRGYIKGLVLGGAETKTYIIDPKSVMKSNEEGYEVYVFRRISDKYMLWWQCCLRGHVKWLLTRDRHAPEAEMQKIIRERPEITHKENGVRYCNVTCYR